VRAYQRRMLILRFVARHAVETATNSRINISWRGINKEQGRWGMRISVNGEVTEVADGVTLADLVAARVASDKGVAAAVDGEVAPKTTWPGRVLHEGAAIELLTAVQGG